MPAEPEPRLIIPYGVARVSEANFGKVAKAEIDISAHKPLRLGDGPYRRKLIEEEAYAPENTGEGEPSVGEARLDILRRLHLRDCDVFDKYLRRWIDLYFELAAKEALCFAASRNAGALPAFDPLLWAMAALRPLPRAHIPDARIMDVANSFTAVDVALWDGDKIVAVVFAGGDKVRRAENLNDRVKLVVAEPPTANTGPEAIAGQLGDAVPRAWQGLAVPPDPFGPAPFRSARVAAPSF